MKVRKVILYDSRGCEGCVFCGAPRRCWNREAEDIDYGRLPEDTGCAPDFNKGGHSFIFIPINQLIPGHTS